MPRHHVNPPSRRLQHARRGDAAADASAEDTSSTTGEVRRDFGRGNIEACECMTVQHALAGQDSLLVVGTDHAAEAMTSFLPSPATAAWT